MIKVTRSEQGEFVREATERIVRMREEFGRLKSVSAEEREDVLNRVFRDMHSLKGAAQAQELRSIAALSHKAEDFLSFHRAGKLLPSDRGSAVFMAALELLQKIVENLQMAKLVDVSSMVALFDDLLKPAARR